KKKKKNRLNKKPCIHPMRLEMAQSLMERLYKSLSFACNCVDYRWWCNKDRDPGDVKRDDNNNKNNADDDDDDIDNDNDDEVETIGPRLIYCWMQFIMVAWKDACLWSNSENLFLQLVPYEHVKTMLCTQQHFVAIANEHLPHFLNDKSHYDFFALAFTKTLGNGMTLSDEMWRLYVPNVVKKFHLIVLCLPHPNGTKEEDYNCHCVNIQSYSQMYLSFAVFVAVDNIISPVCKWNVKTKEWVEMVTWETRLADVPEQIISVCLKLNEREQANNLWKKKPPFGKSFFCIH
ncbi:transcriptional regulatory protein, partial [Reticulomyxa filosa]